MALPLIPSSRLPELRRIEELSTFRDDLVTCQVLDKIQVGQQSYPLHSFVIGSTDPKAPTLGIFGGVHGLERVGCHVAISFLEHLLSQLKWNLDLRKTLETCRVIALPLVNPAGMALRRRSNPHHVDLMRNAPVEAEGKAAFLVGGHRLTRFLPWYRGPLGAPMEKEAHALVQFVSDHGLRSDFGLFIDFHSGFGVRDRLWYPFAKSKTPFPHLPEIQKIVGLLNATLPHHVYLIEPQSATYMTHGDLWDYLFQLSRQVRPQAAPMIPLTLEMGSWMWVRKNPLQLFNVMGLFNPMKPHRHSRIMRRHLSFVDFLLFAVNNHEVWRSAQEPLWTMSHEGRTRLLEDSRESP